MRRLGLVMLMAFSGMAAGLIVLAFLCWVDGTERGLRFWPLLPATAFVGAWFGLALSLIEELWMGGGNGT